MRNFSLVFSRITRSVLLITALSFIGISGSRAQDVAEGKALFKQKCTTCHALNTKLTGPALKDVDKRHDEAWLLKWIKNSQAMIKSGDATAVKLFEENNKVAMSSFPELQDDQIKNILAYIKEGDKPAPGAVAGGAAAGAEQSSGVSNFMILGLLGVIVIAFLVIVVLNKVIRTLERLMLQKQGVAIEEEEEAEKGAGIAKFKQLLKNKKFVFFAILAIAIFMGSWGWMGMWNTGVHTGYQPEQPIKFSHQLHAGVNKIDCQYCHSGAFKSKNSTIPSLNICMNCHKAVTASENYGGQTSPEIQKIYTALGYDPATQTYDKTKQKPIQWVRVHNLPDFAYFNHSQHVKVGEEAIRKVKGLKPEEPVCYACHGPVKEMEEIYQYSPLTMKWCINCHKEAEVTGKGNAFYDKVIAAHERIKKGEKLTVAALGGLECGKCHY